MDESRNSVDSTDRETMDLPSAINLRELGFSSTFPSLTRILEDKAESSLLESTFSYQSCVPETQTKATFLIVISSDGKCLATCHSGDHCINVTEIISGKILRTLTGHTRTVWALAYHPTKSYMLASGCLAGQVRVWDLNTGCFECIVVDEGQSAVASLAFHPCEPLLAVACGNKLHFWNWHHPEPWSECKARGPERVRYVKFDEYGTLLYTGITNAGSAAAKSARQMAPPDIIPFRCHELLNSRRQLIEMRGELSQRHQQLLDRYSDLLRRYRDLQQRYPFVTAEESAEQPASANDSFAVYDRNEMLELRPAGRRLEQMREESASEERPELSPIQLEQLRDAVGYAHQLTQDSMQQFLDHHQMSMERLQRSYMEMSQSARNLVRGFQRTYEDMSRLQDEIDRRLGIPTTPAGQEGANALLRGLTRMQQVLLNNADSDNRADSETDNRPLLRETNTLIEVYDTLLDGDSRRFPDQTLQELQASRVRLVDLRSRLDHMLQEEAIDSNIDHLLANEIHGFRRTIRRWKAIVMNRIRERYGGSATAASEQEDEDQPSTSRDTRRANSGFIRISLSPDLVLAENSATETEQEEPADTAAVMPGPSSSNGGQGAKRIGNVTISPLKSPSKPPTPSGRLNATSASSSSGVEDVNINLSPSRVTRISTSEQNTTVLQYQYPLATRSSESTAEASAGGTNSIPAAKRQKLDFRSSGGTGVPGTSAADLTERSERRNIAQKAPESADISQLNQSLIQGEDGSNHDSSPHGSSEATSGNSSENPNPTPCGQRSEVEETSSASLQPERSAVSSVVEEERTVETQTESRPRLAEHNSVHLDHLASEVELRRSPRRGYEYYRRSLRMFENAASGSQEQQEERPNASQEQRRRLNWEMRRRLVETRSRRGTAPGRPRWLRRRLTTVGEILPTVGPLLAESVAETAREEMVHIIRSAAAEAVSNRADVTDGRRTGLSDEQIMANITMQRPESYPLRAERILSQAAANEESDREDVYSLHRSINRAIAGAFIGSGDVAIANNILDLTCRIQEWKFSPEKELPNLREAEKNVLVQRCKLHNDGSISMSKDGQLLACFVESQTSENPVWADTVLNVVSLRNYDKGTVLYRLGFGPNAISVSISPTDSHILVGLATRRYLRLRQSPDTFAQVYKMTAVESLNEADRKLQLILNLNRVIPEATGENLEAYVEMRRCTMNCSAWLPIPGQGFAYGTNRGHLYLLTPVAGNYWADLHDLGTNRLADIDLAGVAEVLRVDRLTEENNGINSQNVII